MSRVRACVRTCRESSVLFRLFRRKTSRPRPPSPRVSTTRHPPGRFDDDDDDDDECAQRQPHRHPPLAHPATFDFPQQQQQGLDLSKTFMIGRSVVAADLSTSHGADANENSSTVVLPALPAGQCWFRFNATACVRGNRTLVETGLALDEFPVYVRAGALLPVHPWDSAVQHSAAQRGLLEVQVYVRAFLTSRQWCFCSRGHLFVSRATSCFVRCVAASIHSLGIKRALRTTSGEEQGLIRSLCVVLFRS